VHTSALLNVQRTGTGHEDVTVLWNQGVQTDGEVLANRTDTIIRTKTDTICLLLDVAISSDRNVIQKGAEKKLYFDNIEIQQMRNMKWVIPVAFGVTEIVTEGLKKYLEPI